MDIGERHLELKFRGRSLCMLAVFRAVSEKNDASALYKQEHMVRFFVRYRSFSAKQIPEGKPWILYEGGVKIDLRLAELPLELTESRSSLLLVYK